MSGSDVLHYEVTVTILPPSAQLSPYEAEHRARGEAEGAVGDGWEGWGTQHGEDQAFQSDAYWSSGACQ